MKAYKPLYSLIQKEKCISPQQSERSKKKKKKNFPQIPGTKWDTARDSTCSLNEKIDLVKAYI